MPEAKTWRESQPLVTYLIATYNRRDYLSIALRSALDQTYRNLQVIVMRDGGDEVRDIVESFRDERLLLLDRPQNRGLAYTYNEAIPYVKGKYIAYLGDDDIHYPHHIETHVAALESTDQYQASYSRLYRTLFQELPGGQRRTLSKSLLIDRDYDPLQQLYYNLVLGGAAVHRADLLEKTGPYNESVRVLIDWDMMRRIGFFTEFLSIDAVTGEFFTSAQGKGSDRISDKQRQDKVKYFQNCIAIRNNRPPKPWKVYKDVSIIWTPSQVTDRAIERLANMLQLTYTPYEIYIPMTQAELRCLDVNVPVVHGVEVPEGLTPTERFDAALARAQGDYICWAPDQITFSENWLEKPLQALIGHPGEAAALLEGESDEQWGMVVSRPLLEQIRQAHPERTVRQSVEQADVELLDAEGQPNVSPVNRIVRKALGAVREEEYSRAADLFTEAAEGPANDELWVKTCAAWALYNDGGRDDEAIDLCQRILERRSWIDALTLYGKLLRRNDRPNEAIEALEQAREMMDYTVTV
jgi:glycosyltransferase involved in cell wall biosynthesis